jgi:hypothetical protein
MDESDSVGFLVLFILLGKTLHFDLDWYLDYFSLFEPCMFLDQKHCYILLVIVESGAYSSFEKENDNLNAYTEESLVWFWYITEHLNIKSKKL